MTTDLIMQIVVPALLAFVAGHMHLILPYKGPAGPSLPTSFGHGELIQWLLAQLAARQAPVNPASPVNPAPQAPGGEIAAELLAILKAVLSTQPQPPVQVPAVPKVA